MLLSTGHRKQPQHDWCGKCLAGQLVRQRSLERCPEVALAKPLGRSAMACLPGWLLPKAPSSSSLRCAPPKSISDLLQGWPGWGSAKCSRFFLHLRVATLSSQLSTTSYPHGLDRANALVLKLLIILHRRANKKTLQVLECPRSGIVFWETCGSLLLRDTTKQKMRKSCKGDGGESRATS